VLVVRQDHAQLLDRSETSEVRLPWQQLLIIRRVEFIQTTKGRLGVLTRFIGIDLAQFWNQIVFDVIELAESVLEAIHFLDDPCLDLLQSQVALPDLAPDDPISLRQKELKLTKQFIVLFICVVLINESGGEHLHNLVVFLEHAELVTWHLIDVTFHELLDLLLSIGIVFLDLPHSLDVFLLVVVQCLVVFVQKLLFLLVLCKLDLLCQLGDVHLDRLRLVTLEVINAHVFVFLPSFSSPFGLLLPISYLF